MSTIDSATLYVGDATVVEDATDRREHRGRVVVLAKPDGTVLVHDADGYQPLAWVTRADAVTVTDDDAFRVTAHDERADDWLRVTGHEDAVTGQYPVSASGTPVGDCPACDGALVDAGGAVSCVHCGVRHGYPDDADIHGAVCGCGLPRMRVERGAAIDCCVDRECERLDDHVREHVDRAFECPDCDGELVVQRERGLFLACEDRPDCDVAFYVPSGVQDGHCECGLPAFDVAAGRRCLDATCGAL